MKVCKFGGSSLTSKEKLKTILHLTKSKERKVLVFSAIGVTENSKKLTDLLLDLARNKNNIEKYIKNKILIIEKLKFLTKLCGVNFDVEKNVNKILKKYKINNDNNYLTSRGEYLTCLILSGFLHIKFVPAEKIVCFESKNKINYLKTKNKLKSAIKKYGKIIIPGFYGVDSKNNLVLMQRGGGDLTGAIVARCLGANIYENWTDTDGIKEINPKIMPSKTIKNLSYADLNLITKCDAKVIQNKCAETLKNSNTILLVKNINNPHGNFTKVTKNFKGKNHFVTIKKLGKNFCVIAKNFNNDYIIKKVTKNINLTAKKMYADLN